MVIKGTIKLNARSQELIKQYLNEKGNSGSSVLHGLTASIPLPTLLTWLQNEDVHTLKKNAKEKKMEFLLASLRAELLKDLSHGMEGDALFAKKPDEPPSIWSKLKFILLAVTGSLLAAFEGFDGITTLMGFVSAPSLLILAIGLAFSALSVVVFYGFDLVQVSNNLGIKLRDAPKLLNAYLLQMNEIKTIRKKINSYILANMTVEELQRAELIITMLQIRFAELNKASKQFESALHSKHMKIARYALTGVAGLVFFSGGFFAGQSVSMFLLGLFTASVSATFWPVILSSIAVGLAAFCIYWYVERVGLKQLISGWFGLDEEKIEQLCDASSLEKEEGKLSALKNEIKCCENLVRKVSELKHKITKLEHREKTKEYQEIPKKGTNVYAFHAPKNNKPLDPERILDEGYSNLTMSS